MTRAPVQTMKRAWLFALLAWGIVAAPVRADGPSLQVYCWQGKGTGSNLLNKQFTPKWKAVLNDGKGATIAIDTDARRRALATELGAGDVLDGRGSVDAVRELTGGRGADLVFDFVGSDQSHDHVERSGFSCAVRTE